MPPMEQSQSYQLDYSKVADSIDEKLAQRVTCLLEEPKRETVSQEQNYLARGICIALALGYLYTSERPNLVESLVCTYGVLISSVDLSRQVFQYLWCTVAAMILLKYTLLVLPEMGLSSHEQAGVQQQEISLELMIVFAAASNVLRLKL